MRFLLVTVLILTVAVLLTQAPAQPPGGRGFGGPDGPPDGFRPPRNLIAEAIDADGNEEISAAEMAKAADALKTLDRNKDGKLTHDELHDQDGPRRRGPDGRGPDGPDRGPQRGAGLAGLDRLMSLDRNKDGQLSKDELPTRMQSALDRHDANKDGVLDKSELERFADSLAGPQEGGGRGRRGDGPPDDGPRGFDGPRRGGPPSPEEFVERAMAFDKDEDGRLDADELRAMADEFARRGPGRGGPEGRGGDRPQRPE